MEIVKSKMANALTSADSNHIIAVAADVYDETQGDYQSNINQNLIDEIEELKSSGGGGGGGTPSGDLAEYAKITYVDEEVQKAKNYTDEQIGNIGIPELPDLAKVAETGDYNDLENKPTIPDVSGLATKDEVETAFTEFEGVVEQGFYTKQDKTAIVTATNSVSVDKRSVINVNGDVVISLESYVSDGYAHSYEIVLNVGNTAYSVAFPDSVKWVKDLEIVPNARYFIIIEDNTAMWTAVIK